MFRWCPCWCPGIFDRTSSFSSLESASSRWPLINTPYAWTSVQRTAQKYELDMVPTQVTSNVRLVIDVALDTGEKGLLYYSEESFYNSGVPPEYAWTVSTDIYQRVLRSCVRSTTPFQLRVASICVAIEVTARTREFRTTTMLTFPWQGCSCC